MDVSIVIANWNTREILSNCLNSVYAQTSNVQFEVIVVDNASSDGSAEMIRSEFPAVSLIVNDTNRGFAAANNQGIIQAKGRYVLLLNSDTIICDAAIERTVAYADDHVDVAVVGCQVYGKKEIPQITCFRFPSVLNLFLEVFALSRIFKKNRFFGRQWLRWWPRDSERLVDVVAGVFMLVRREAIDEVGLMDESYFFLCEETDWCYRFSKAGWKILFWPGAKIVHVRGGKQSRKKANLEMMVQSYKSTLRFFRKHYGTIEYLLARLLLAIHCGYRFVAWSFLTCCKKIVGRDTMREVTKMHGSWQSFKYCAFGYE